MANKTAGVKTLVQEVLATFQEPYSKDVIWDVFKAIQLNPDWSRWYGELCDELSNGVVNSWIGKYTKDLARMNNVRQMPVDGPYIKSYTELR